MSKRIRLFLDLDGVLADFDTHLANVAGMTRDEFLRQRARPEFDDEVWESARKDPDFYLNIPMMNHRLWNFCKELEPIILTAVPKAHRNMPMAGAHKVQWVYNNLGPQIPVIICQREQKYIFAGPDKILIDDRASNISDWMMFKGVGFLHSSEDVTLYKLKNFLIGV